MSNLALKDATSSPIASTAAPTSSSNSTAHGLVRKDMPQPPIIYTTSSSSISSLVTTTTPHSSSTAINSIGKQTLLSPSKTSTSQATSSSPSSSSSSSSEALKPQESGKKRRKRRILRLTPRQSIEVIKFVASTPKDSSPERLDKMLQVLTKQDEKPGENTTSSSSSSPTSPPENPNNNPTSVQIANFTQKATTLDDSLQKTVVAFSETAPQCDQESSTAQLEKSLQEGYNQLKTLGTTIMEVLSASDEKSKAEQEDSDNKSKLAYEINIFSYLLRNLCHSRDSLFKMIDILESRHIEVIGFDPDFTTPAKTLTFNEKDSKVKGSKDKSH